MSDFHIYHLYRRLAHEQRKINRDNRDRLGANKRNFSICCNINRGLRYADRRSAIRQQTLRSRRLIVLRGAARFCATAVNATQLL